MTHISHPYAVRIGVLRTWRSRWFSDKEYRALLREDLAIRDFLQKRLRGMAVESIEIERTQAALSIVIKTARPGLLIGRGGEGAEKLKEEIRHILATTRKDIATTRQSPRQKNIIGGKQRRQSDMRLVIEEVKIPEAHANIMAEHIAQDLEKRLPFRRVMKQAIGKMMASRGVDGAKVALAGRLDGSEMARFEWLKNGKIPLQTLRADVDFARARAHLPYGDIGVKVWIYKGEIFSEK